MYTCIEILDASWCNFTVPLPVLQYQRERFEQEILHITFAGTFLIAFLFLKKDIQ
jgi:hypothetical protein